MKKKEFRVFLCPNCGNEVKLGIKECEGYWNWKCEKCYEIMPEKGMLSSPDIWKCSKPTVRKRTVHT
jgi:hypothetical protein